jgi:PTS system galactosamine-specific IIC component
MACFCEMPNLLPVALLGTVFALIDFFGVKQRKDEIEEAVKNAGITGGDTNVGI